METTIKNLKLKDVKVVLNTGLSKGNRILICSLADFKDIVGEDEYEDLIAKERMSLLIKEKKEKETILETAKAHIDKINEKIMGLTGKGKYKVI